MLAAANPSRITMAMAIERYFDMALYLLVLTGFGTLASTGGLDLLAVVVGVRAGRPYSSVSQAPSSPADRPRH